MQVEDQLKWLEQELALTSKQVAVETNKLNVRVRDLQRAERRSELETASKKDT